MNNKSFTPLEMQNETNKLRLPKGNLPLTGFTLLELVIVIVIIGILATLGYNQYNRIVEERGRAGEARMILGQIRSAAIGYKIQYGDYPSNISQLPVEAPTACTSTHYFYYSVPGPFAPIGIASAMRCTGGQGKTPSGASYYWLRIYFDAGTLQICRSIPTGWYCQPD